MKRLDWLSCWDELRDKLSERTTWGRTQIIDEMDKIERKKIRELEQNRESDQRPVESDSACTCKGFHRPTDCPVHGHKARGL